MGLRQFISRCRVAVEDAVLTAPMPGYVPRFLGDEAALMKGVAELRARGYTSVGCLFSPKEIAYIKSLIDSAVQRERAGVTAEWSEQVEYWRILNPFCLDPLFLRLAVHPLVIALVERYFGRRPYLADVDMRRIPPKDMAELEKKGYSSSNWHHDTRGRQLKMMIYLTDVGESDSNFALLPSTHGAYRRKNEHMESRFSDEEVDAMQIKPLEWYGMAGEAMLFDTNLIHRLRRKPTANTRDSITFYYTPGQALAHLALDRDALRDLPEEARTIFGNPPWRFRYRSVV